MQKVVTAQPTRKGRMKMLAKNQIQTIENPRI